MGSVGSVGLVGLNFSLSRWMRLSVRMELAVLQHKQKQLCHKKGSDHGISVVIMHWVGRVHQANEAHR